MSKLQPVRGTHDILPEESRERRFIVDTARQIAQNYGYGELSTPVFEFDEVFHRTLGDTSDVVTKETYTFQDRGGETITLRPEFTAGVARAFISNGMQQDLPCKFFYNGPAFRYERPQKGRLRQFHQLGVELLGAAEPLADVETIALGWQLLSALNLTENAVLEINSLGDAESRMAYREALVAYLREHESKLSEDSKTRLEKNPLRVLDSKDAGDQEIVKGAPSLAEHFTPAAKEFFATVQAGLEALGIPFTLNDRLVRGLDYYCHTVFEIKSGALGSQNAVLSGGRYDGLVGMMGGPATPGVGWAAGIERLHMLVDFGALNGYSLPTKPVAIVPVSEAEHMPALLLAQRLRTSGLVVEMGYSGNVGKRMKRADKKQAAWALILGADEVAGNTVQAKHLQTGEQHSVRLDEIEEFLRSK